ncbi:MAG: hypothetical protein ACO207_00255 [Bacilli bacterium]
MKIKPFFLVSIICVFGMTSLLFSPFLFRLIEVRVGTPEVLLTAAERNALNLHTWPDGNIGIIKNDETYTFYGTNGGLLSKTSGTIGNPTNQVFYTNRTIQGLKENYNYAGGGPVFKAGEYLFMFYHAEYHPNQNFQQFYSTIGIAYSSDEGETFYDLGKIIQTRYVLNEDDPVAVEMTGAPFFIQDDYIFVFFRDTITTFQQNNLAVARCSITNLLLAITQNETPNFSKYFQGSFTEPGLRGKSSALEFLNGNIRWFDVGFDSKKNQYVLVFVDDTIIGQNLYLMFSQDLFHWGPRINLTFRSGEIFYPTLIGQEHNPKYSNGSWWIYYTYSALGSWSRWQDANLERLEITL